MREQAYEIINQENWKRAQHCQIFRQAQQPQYCISFELDVTNFLKRVREEKWSFTLAFVYAVAKCANGVEEFRYRFEEGEVVLYRQIHTSFSYLNKETELFKMVNVPMQDCMEEYLRIAGETEKLQKEYFTGPVLNDAFLFSPLPWITFTHCSHTESGKRDNAVPVFQWGKYREQNGKVSMPFSIQAHHSFVDGFHMGKLADRIQKYLDEM